MATGAELDISKVDNNADVNNGGEIASGSTQIERNTKDKQLESQTPSSPEQNGQEFTFSDLEDDEIQFVSHSTIAPIIELRGDRLARHDIIRNRMYNESFFYLNNSNSKMVAVGIVPTSLGMGPIRRFTTEIKITGERCIPFTVGNLNDFFQLMLTIRSSPGFRDQYTEVSAE